MASKKKAASALPAYDKSNPKDSLGALKVPLRLLPNVPMIYTALVFELGAFKYGEYNWRNVAVRISVYIEAAKRHLMYLEAGQDVDEESGLPHSAHIIACMCIIEDARACGQLRDDRREKDGASDLLTALTSQNYTAKSLSLTRTPAQTLDEVRGAPIDPVKFREELVAGYRAKVAARPAR